MGTGRDRRRRSSSSKSNKSKSKRKNHSDREDEVHEDDSSSPSSRYSTTSSSGSDSDTSLKHRSHRRSIKKSTSKRDRRLKKRDKSKRSSTGSRSKRRSSRRKRKDEYSDSDDTDPDSYSSSSSEGGEQLRPRPEDVVKDILKAFPNVANDLKQLLQMIDDGQAVDIRGLSERSLIKHLQKLFVSLNLKRNVDGVFLRPSNVRPALEVVGPLIGCPIKSKDTQPGNSVLDGGVHEESGEVGNKGNAEGPGSRGDFAPPSRRVIGPAMPSAELLAAAAKLTEAEAEMRHAELEDDDELFIGPPPPAVVSEVESANDAERFEEVTRIMGVGADSPYDVLGVNINMSAENVKKRYWKLSLMVHPDKCSHPQAHQAFILLNKAFKDLQDPDKRKALDEKIKQKEEQELFKVELKAMREAAQWRRLQGISMEGDDELLADMSVKAAPTRDEWMTTLPPERKPGVSMQTRKFSKSSKEGRGDTSIWTDSPLDRAEKAKQNYLEAYNEASALASNEEQKLTNADADLVDKYNKAKRSKSLVEKHQEEFAGRSKKKSKQKAEKEEWVGQHPWKPWDREKDLTAGRQSVKLEAENMAQGLTSRFSSGNFQRNFL